jgi:hypothetical protein
MTTDSLIAVIAAFAILNVVVVVAVVVVVRRIIAGRRQAVEEARRAEASARGWTFDVAREGPSLVHHWRGVTDGIEWVAQSIGTAPRGAVRPRMLNCSRWRTVNVRGPAALVLCLGVQRGKERPDITLGRGEGRIASLLQAGVRRGLGEGLVRYLGEETAKAVDAEALTIVDGVNIPGFTVMAVDPPAAARVLLQGLESRLNAAIRDTTSLLSDEDRPWILLWPGGVAIGQRSAVQSSTDVERFISGGTALVKAARF